MLHVFDLGPHSEIFRTLCQDYPESTIYPGADFRVEWGPIFYRGRLDGSARILVIGQDPAAHECIARRILVGEAGQRLQGFLAKLGVTRSYVMINTFLYGVYGQKAGEKHKKDPAIINFRNRWLDALLLGSKVQAVVALGALAEEAWLAWKKTAAGQGLNLPFVRIIHPTQPESSSKGNPAKKAEAIKKMLLNWNEGLNVLKPALTAPDVVRPPELYGQSLRPQDLADIPEEDLPAGVPAWMRGQKSWADRTGTGKEKRRTITVDVTPSFVL